MKKRIDLILVEKKLAPTRTKAQSLLMAGLIRVDGQKVEKSGTLVDDSADVQVKEALPYVSRGGIKLAGALDSFSFSVDGLTVMDVGASTGGFTDCLLQRGASFVYAVDVGYGQLDYKLAQDRRVKVLDRTNIRYLSALPEKVDLVVIDVSFISLKLVLPKVKEFLKDSGRVIALVKPQFEVGKGKVGKKGLVKDPALHRQVLEEVTNSAYQAGYTLQSLTFSPILGPVGNTEFFILLENREGFFDQEKLFIFEKVIANATLLKGEHQLC